MDIKFEYFADSRFKLLGELTGRGKYDAIGRYADLVRTCTERGQAEISKALADATVELKGFADFLVEAEIVEEVAGKIRLAERVEWLSKARERQKSATAAAQARWDKERQAGLFDSSASDSASNPASDSASSGASEGASNGASNQHPPLSPFPFPLSPIPLPLSPKLSDGASPPPGGRKPKAPKPEPVTQKAWEAYAAAYEKRHKAPPVRNATVSAQLAQVVKRLGAEAAPQVAAFYLTHSDQLYVRSRHPVGLLLRDCEKLHTDWVTNSRVTSAGARDEERKAGNAQAFGRLLRGDS